VSRRNALPLLIELRRRERDRVATIAAQAQRDTQNAAGTLRMLDGYRLDYMNRSPKTSMQATDPARLQIHDAFVGKLGEAIDDQTSRLRMLSEREAAQRVALAEQERRLKALEILSHRRETERRRRLETLDQKLNDEFAAQAHRRALHREDRDD
jgi:flagellar export protein FliJ